MKTLSKILSILILSILLTSCQGAFLVLADIFATLFIISIVLFLIFCVFVIIVKLFGS